MYNIVDSIICDEFDKKVKRWQSKEEKPVAMQLTFRISTEYEVEEGYRHLDMLIYGHCNYVAVLVRERWNVIPNVELETVDDEEYIKTSSKGYREGSTGWKLASYHDSCWRSDGVHNVIYKNKDRISGIDSLFGWYQRIEMTEELFETIETLTSRKGEYYYVPDKGVLHFLSDGKEYTNLRGV